MRIVLLATRRLTADYFRTVSADLGDPDLELDVVAWAPPQEPLGATVRKYALIGPGRMPVAQPATAARPTARPAARPAATVRAAATTKPSKPLVRSRIMRIKWVMRGTYRMLRKQGARVVLKQLCDRFNRSRPARRLRARMAKDVSRQYWSRLQSRPDVLAVVDQAAVVVTMDAKAIWAGWKLGRRRPGVPVVNGVPAARRELENLRSTRTPSSMHDAASPC